jgi:hypothetical protein
MAGCLNIVRPIGFAKVIKAVRAMKGTNANDGQLATRLREERGNERCRQRT